LTLPAFGSFVRATLIALAIATHDSASAADAATEPPAIAPHALRTFNLEGGAAAHSPTGRGLLREDRLRHFSLSFALGMGVGLATDNAAAAGGVSAGLGLLKELDDARRPSGFDGWDLLADVLGASLAAWAISALDR